MAAVAVSEGLIELIYCRLEISSEQKPCNAAKNLQKLLKLYIFVVGSIQLLNHLDYYGIFD